MNFKEVAVGVFSTIVLCLIIAFFVSYNVGTKQGEIGVVVSGGPLDKKRPIDFIDPGTGLNFVGALNRVHRYPSNKVNRWVSFNSASMDSQDPYFATTKDGFKVGVKGRIYFRFIGEKNKDLSLKFDREYGSRKFFGKFPHAGDDGFGKFLDVMVLPIVKNSLRKQINEANCSVIDRSCALIAESKDSGVTDIQSIEKRINEEISQSIKQKLGSDYLVDFRTNILETELTENIQQQVNAVSVSRSRIKQKRLDVEAARQEAKAIRIRGLALSKNSQIACIEAAKILKDAAANVNIIIDASCRGKISVVPGSGK